MLSDQPPPESQRNILFEFTSLGHQIRVAAIDPDTGIEVVIIAPKTASQAQMQQIAKAKLERRLLRDTVS